MTGTLDRPVGDRHTPHRDASAEQMLSVLLDAGAVAAQLNADELSSASPRGQLVVALSDLARLATRQLGGVLGAPVGDAPGVVVVRDLACSTRALARAIADPAVPYVADLAPRAQVVAWGERARALAEQLAHDEIRSETAAGAAQRAPGRNEHVIRRGYRRLARAVTN